MYILGVGRSIYCISFESSLSHLQAGGGSSTLAEVYDCSKIGAKHCSGDQHRAGH